MFIKRDGKDDCLIAGFVVGDQKNKEYNGKKYIEFGISMGKDEKGENLPIVNVAVWERQIPAIHKGDRALAAGKLKMAEKDGKTYYSLSADFCIVEAIETASIPAPADMEPVDDDDLPF